MNTLDVVLITIATVIALVIFGAGILFWLRDKSPYESHYP
jgi:hypothetical protein